MFMLRVECFMKQTEAEQAFNERRVFIYYDPAVPNSISAFIVTFPDDSGVAYCPNEPVGQQIRIFKPEHTADLLKKMDGRGYNAQTGDIIKLKVDG